MSSVLNSTPAATQSPLLGTPQIGGRTPSPTGTVIGPSPSATTTATPVTVPSTSSTAAPTSTASQSVQPSPSPSASEPASSQPASTSSTVSPPPPSETTPTVTTTSTSPSTQTPSQTTLPTTATETQTVTPQPSPSSATSTQPATTPSSCPDFLCPPIQPSAQPSCIDLSRAPPFRALSSVPIFLPTDLSPWAQARFPPGTPASDTLLRASRSIRSPEDLQTFFNLIVSDWNSFNLHLTGGCSVLPNHRHSLTFLVVDLAAYFQANPCNSVFGTGRLPDLRICSSARDERLAAMQSDLATASANSTCSPNALLSLQQLPSPLISADTSTCRSSQTLGLDSRVLCGYASSTIAAANKCDAALSAATAPSNNGGWTASLITGVSLACIVLALLFFAAAKLAVRAVRRWCQERNTFRPGAGGNGYQYMPAGSVGRAESPTLIAKPRSPYATHAFVASTPPPPRPPRPNDDVGPVYRVVAVRPSASSLASDSSSNSSLQGSLTAPSPTLTAASLPALHPPTWAAPGSWRGPAPVPPAAPVLAVHTPTPARPTRSGPVSRSPVVGAMNARRAPPALLKVSSAPAIGSPLRMDSTELLRNVDADDAEA